ncbi:MAG: putative ATP-dependent RNA helicase DHR1 [Vezdaea aestivalis]|nr:MAG: putative ATP-dependent RNA helicase DHR1 [Vezdaea aestivalis]
MPKFVARQRKHKVRRREEDNGLRPSEESEDRKAATGSAIRAQLRQEFVKNDSAKLSSKKKKRLDKYIESKLKKEANASLMTKLGEAKIDTSQFQSSKDLSFKAVTQREAQRRSGPRSRLGSDTDEVVSDDYSSGESLIAELQNQSSSEGKLVIGDGLKRPVPLDSYGKPMISKKRKRGGVAKQLIIETDDSSDASSWYGFSEPIDSSSGQEDGSLSDYSSENDNESDEVSTAQPSVFKKWFLAQREKELNERRAEESNIPPPIFKPRKPDDDRADAALGPLYDNSTFQQMQGLLVERSKNIQKARLELPVVAEEQRIIETIQYNPVTIICGATGSGKTTQIPQFLLEIGYGNPKSPAPGIIGVTQPRRVAAISMSKRVGKELGAHFDRVSYQIRYESNVDSNTAIKFMTDGIMLREAAEDITMEKYSVIIIDEAHERSINTDLLIGMLSRVVKLRQDLASESPPRATTLKLVIMSATLDISGLVANTKLFPTPPPIVNIEGRQHPVSMHFSPTTETDYLEEMCKKVRTGHRKLPPGGFLVFLTGQKEIRELMENLYAAEGIRIGQRQDIVTSGKEVMTELDDFDFGSRLDDRQSKRSLKFDDEEDVIFKGLDGHKSLGHNEEEFDLGIIQPAQKLQMHILPLYSLLSTEDQMRVFDSPPHGSRLIVIATNVAETSLTIPGIRYVFDCGRAKESSFDPLTGVQKYEINLISKASAMQRAGRAGRSEAGHCYRLYSSLDYQRKFPDHTSPQILRTPLEAVVLELKAMGIKNVTNFPFPTEPDAEVLSRAENALLNLRALTIDGEVTDSGRQMSALPIPTRFARVLIIGDQHDCLAYVVALVAGLSVENIFLSERDIGLADPNSGNILENVNIHDQASLRDEYSTAQTYFRDLYDPRCDALKLLAAILTYSASPLQKEFCKTHFLRVKAMRECQLLRTQLHSILSRNSNILSSPVPPFTAVLPPPTIFQCTIIKQLLGVGFVDHVAIRGDIAPIPPATPMGMSPRSVYVPLLSPTDSPFAYVAHNSNLSALSPVQRPHYVIYSHLRSVINTVGNTKVLMFPLTPVKDTHLRELAKGTPLLEWGKPLKSMPFKKGRDQKGEFIECWAVPMLSAGPGRPGWELPAKQVVMRKVLGKGFVVQ